MQVAWASTVTSNFTGSVPKYVDLIVASCAEVVADRRNSTFPLNAVSARLKYSERKESGKKVFVHSLCDHGAIAE